VHLLGGLAKRIGWGLGDQAFSSLTNFALGVAVARLVSASDFGAYAIAFATYLVALNVTRQLAAQPLGIRYSHVEPPEWRRVTGAAVGLVLVLAVAMGVLCVLVGAAVGGALGDGLLAMGVTLPGLLAQDAWRLAFFAAGRGAAALANDVVWALILIPAIATLKLTGTATLFSIIVTWGLSASAAALVGGAQSRVWPAPRQAGRWLRQNRDIGFRYLASELTSMGATQIVLYVVGAIAGLAAAGSLRAAQLLMGPVNILSQGVYVASVPEAARLFRTSRRRFGQACVLVSIGITGGALATVAAILVAPDVIGPLFLGDSWGGAAIVFGPVAVMFLFRGAAIGGRIGLLSMGAAPRMLRLSVLDAVLSIVAGVIGTLAWGVVGAATGLAIVAAVMSVFWWSGLRAALVECTDEAALLPAEGTSMPGGA